MTNQELLDGFYAAFARRDGATMARAYAPSATFSDPAFPDLKGDQPGAMWRMLTSRSTDLSLELVACIAKGDTGSARWIATYTFTQTGRTVVNDVQSRFRFVDGLIVDQVDAFDFPRWSRQALGTKGWLLGWTPVLRKAVQKQARSGLAAFMAAEGQR